MNTCEPQSIRAGDTLKWTKSLCDYSAADGWALSYRFISASSKFDIAATQDGSSSDFAVSVDAGTSAGYAAGTYRWVARVSKDGEKYTVGEGTVTVLPDLADASVATDPRSQNERILDAINALIEGRATSDVQSYKIHERELTKMSIQDLLYWRGIYAALVASEQTALSGVPARRIVKPVFRGRS